MPAFFARSLFLDHMVQLDASSTTDLAGRSGCDTLSATPHQRLGPCEPSTASVPDSRPRIKALSHHAGSVFAFCRLPGLNRRPTPFDGVALPIELSFPIAAGAACCFMIFWITKYNPSHEFPCGTPRLASTRAGPSCVGPAQTVVTAAQLFLAGRTVQLPFTFPARVFGLVGDAALPGVLRRLAFPVALRHPGA